MVKKYFKIFIIFIFGIIFLSGCYSGYQGDKVITEQDLNTRLEELKKINKYPDNKKINHEKYPKVIGIYSKNNLVLMEQYFCSDICPDYGAIYIVYKDIKTKEKCAEIWGKDLVDVSWGGYIGCSPK